MIKMQKDAADAPNSQQKPQHWINKSQINKKSKSNTFFKKIPVKKGLDKRNKDTRGKSHNTGKYAGGGTWSGHAQQDFGRKSAGQNAKYGEFHVSATEACTLLPLVKIGERFANCR